MNGENKISVVINTYNAEQYLEQVLDAVKDFDETLICDMESTDRTVEIARRRGCRIVTFPKGNHVCAEPARTFAIQSAAFHWVLVVDADEIVTPQLRDYLYKRIATGDCPEGLYIPRRNMLLGRYERGFAQDHQLRFFIREGTTWPPYVHTFPTVQGTVAVSYDKAAGVMEVTVPEGSRADVVVPGSYAHTSLGPGKHKVSLKVPEPVAAGTYPFQDAGLPVEKRVKDLLKRMSVVR